MNQRVEKLYEVTEKLKQDRAEAGKLLQVGKDRIKECKKTLKDMQADYIKMKARNQDAGFNYQRLVKRTDEELKKVELLKKKYKEILEELCSNNKWYKTQNAELLTENTKLKKENVEILESLMAYLMLNQDSANLKGSAKAALGPLAETARDIRVPTPVDEPSSSDEEVVDPKTGKKKKQKKTGPRGFNKPRNISLATQAYPLNQGIDLPPAPDHMDELLSPRITREKEVPIMLGSMAPEPET